MHGIVTKTRLRMAAGLMALMAVLSLGVLDRGDAGAIARHFPLEDLISTAHRVVHARVSGESSAFDSDNRQIWTTWTLEVSEKLKDAAPAGADLAAGTLCVHTRGGTVGRITQKTSGEPGLSVGGEYLLFLWKDQAGYWNILGQTQGAFMVIREEGQAARARNVYRGTRVVMVNGQAMPEKVGPIDQELEALKTTVRAAVALDAVEGPGSGAPQVPVPGTGAVTPAPGTGAVTPVPVTEPRAGLGATGTPVHAVIPAGRAG